VYGDSADRALLNKPRHNFRFKWNIPLSFIYLDKIVVSHRSILLDRPRARNSRIIGVAENMSRPLPVMSLSTHYSKRPPNINRASSRFLTADAWVISQVCFLQSSPKSRLCLNNRGFHRPWYSHQPYVWIFTRQHATLLSLDFEHQQMTLKNSFLFFNFFKKPRN